MRRLLALAVVPAIALSACSKTTTTSKTVIETTTTIAASRMASALLQPSDLTSGFTAIPTSTDPAKTPCGEDSPVIGSPGFDRGATLLKNGTWTIFEQIFTYGDAAAATSVHGDFSTGLMCETATFALPDGTSAAMKLGQIEDNSTDVGGDAATHDVMTSADGKTTVEEEVALIGRVIVDLRIESPATAAPNDPTTAAAVAKAAIAKAKAANL